MSSLVSVCIAVVVMFICRKNYFLRTSAISTLVLVIAVFLLNPIRPWIGFSEETIQLWRIVIRLRVAFTFIMAGGAVFVLMFPVYKALSNKLSFDEKE